MQDRVVRRPRWRRALERALAARPSELDGVDLDLPVVVVCQWRRADRAPALLADIAAQQGVRCTLVVWSNHPLASRALERSMRAVPAGAIVDARLVRSRTNLGGLARFVVARHLHDAGHRGPIVTIDDDMHLGPDAIATLVAASAPRAYVGHWAWNPVGEDYYGRVMADDGGPASYVGTGGAAIDPSIADDRFFDALPDRYAAIEDLWASIVARHRGWDMRRVAIDATYDDDGRDQYRALEDRKRELWQRRAALVQAPSAAHDGDVALDVVGPRELLGWARSALPRAARRLLRRG